jgi:hypothetical protein
MQRAPPDTEPCQGVWLPKGKRERFHARFLFVASCYHSGCHFQRCFLLLSESLEYAEVRIIGLEGDRG